MTALVVFDSDIAVCGSDCLGLSPGEGSRWQQHDWDIFRLLIKENPGSLVAVGVGLRKEERLSVVTAVSGSGQNFLCVLQVHCESPRFTVIDVNVKLPALTDIHDEVIPGVIAVTPAKG